MVLENNKNENFKYRNFNGKCFIFDPLHRDRKPFFKILPDFRHRSDQIYHIWKSPLGDPLIVFAEYIRRMRTMAIETFRILNSLAPPVLTDLLKNVEQFITFDIQIFYRFQR